MLISIFINPATQLPFEIVSNKILLNPPKLKHFTQTVKTKYKIQNKRPKNMEGNIDFFEQRILVGFRLLLQI